MKGNSKRTSIFFMAMVGHYSDMDGEASASGSHVAEALQYRGEENDG